MDRRGKRGIWYCTIKLNYLVNSKEILEEYRLEKIYKKIKEDIENLKFMPRIHKTLISFKDDKGEYRRIISGNYIIIYEILGQEINILRIYNQKENYLNQENFILREKSNKYLVIQSKRRIF